MDLSLFSLAFEQERRIEYNTGSCTALLVSAGRGSAAITPMTANKRYQRTSVLQRFIKSVLDSPGFRNRTLLAISFSVLGAYIGTAMINPVRVLYAQEHGASLPIIGAMASAYLVSDFLFGYPLGWLADRWGRKQVILIGMAAQALLSALYLPVSDPVLFIVLRFLEGIAAAS